MRTAENVFYDHLQKRKEGALEDDIKNNYDTNVILLTGSGVFRGHQGVRDSAKDLKYYTNNADFTYEHTLLEGNYAFLEWTARGNGKLVSDGADSFVIENGKIVLQTIHYSVKNAPKE